MLEHRTSLARPKAATRCNATACLTTGNLDERYADIGGRCVVVECNHGPRYLRRRLGYASEPKRAQACTLSAGGAGPAYIEEPALEGLLRPPKSMKHRPANSLGAREAAKCHILGPYRCDLLPRCCRC